MGRTYLTMRIHEINKNMIYVFSAFGAITRIITRLTNIRAPVRSATKMIAILLTGNLPLIT